MQDKYTVKTLQYDDGILDNCVDVTYIIHLEGNGREPDIMKELQKIHPTNTVHIVYNKGYRKYGKDLGITNTTDDLIHCYLWIFEHYKSSQKDNTARKKNVLILEDDFIFNDKIAEIDTRKKIENTLETIQHNRFILRLGCIPLLICPCTEYTYTGFAVGAHCVIYNEKCIDYTLSNREYIIDWDVYCNTTYSIKQYIYKEPLCYQLFPETENQNNWGNGNIFLIVISHLLIKYLRFLRLDKQVEPGYSISYNIGLLFAFILVCLVLYIFYNVFTYFLKYTSKTRSSFLRRR